MIRRFTQLDDIQKLLSRPTVRLVDAALNHIRFPFEIFPTWEVSNLLIWWFFSFG